MNFPEINNWVWPALALAFYFGVMAARWWWQKRSAVPVKVNQEYFKGLNYLLNEQPDQAIEVFIKALEVDSETVELHLALGGLFRRKGQVDRATRIHQNLIARPNLTNDQRLQAIYELAQDYYKAGLLDRAENLFIELKESVNYRKPALDGLCRIYQQEKEWKKAIEVSRLHKRSERSQYSRIIAHYWCELAVQALDSSDYDTARKYLRSALSEDRASARAVLLRGELSFQQQDFRAAVQLWQSLAATNPSLAALVVEQTIICFEKLNDQAGLKDYLLRIASIPKEPAAFEVWRQSLIALFGEETAQERIFSQVQVEGLSGPVASYLLQNTGTGSFSSGQQNQLLKELLERAINRQIEYTCARCGFDTKALHWLCPNCGEWESFN